MGPLNSKPHLEKVLRYINYAVEDGGKVLCGHGVDSLELPSQSKEVMCTCFNRYIMTCNEQYQLICNNLAHWRITITHRSWIMLLSLSVHSKGTKTF